MVVLGSSKNEACEIPTGHVETWEAPCAIGAGNAVGRSAIEGAVCWLVGACSSCDNAAAYEGMSKMSKCHKDEAKEAMLG